MTRSLLYVCVGMLIPSLASAQLGSPATWYAINVGTEGFACGECGSQTFPGCGCEGWLSCLSGICEAAGGYAEPCWYGDSRAAVTGCLENLGCVEDLCIPVGSPGETCRSEAFYFNPYLTLVGKNPNQWEPSCNPGLYCVDSICEETSTLPPVEECAGEEGCECRRAERRVGGCDSGLLCDQHKECRDLWELSFRALRASLAAYNAEDADESLMQENLEKGGNLSKAAWSNEVGWWQNDVEALIAVNEEVIVVAVAGSESTADWIANLDILDGSWWTLLFPGIVPNIDRVDLVDPHDKYDAGWMPCPASGCATPVFRVHEGFLDYAHDIYWGFVKDKLRAALNAKRRPIQVVGHSLGGAVAQLLAGQIVTEMGEPIDAVVTFGSPKVGDADWERWYESMLHRTTHRWVLEADPIPNLPVRDDWKRAGQQHYMTSVVGYTFELDSANHAKRAYQVVLGDHSLQNSYLPALEKIAPCDHPRNESRCP